MKSFDDLEVLDFGCGSDHDQVGFAVYSRPKRPIGIDISPTSLSEAEDRLKLHNGPSKTGSARALGNLGFPLRVASLITSILLASSIMLSIWVSCLTSF